MNCRPGDLAFLIRAHYPENVGKIVRVLEFEKNWDGSPAWFCEFDRPSPCSTYYGKTLDARMVVRDANLRPIRPEREPESQPAPPVREELPA